MSKPEFIKVNPETLRAVQAGFDQRKTFIAKRRVDSMAIGPPEDRIICRPGDEITVLRWHCQNGPTSIRVRPLRGGRCRSETCIPFGWVMEAGPAADLAQYMPFAPHTWEEILEVNTPERYDEWDREDAKERFDRMMAQDTMSSHAIGSAEADIAKWREWGGEWLVAADLLGVKIGEARAAFRDEVEKKRRSLRIATPHTVNAARAMGLHVVGLDREAISDDEIQEYRDGRKSLE